MEKKVNFICSASIDYNIDKLDIYDSFDLVSRGEKVADLSIDADKEILNNHFEFDIKKIDIIYSATSGQTNASAKKINKLHLNNTVEIIITELLAGVRFSMQELIPKHEFESLGYKDAIKKARNKFIENFFEDRLLEKKQAIIDRMEGLLVLLQNSNKSNILCIGHAFYLKLLEAYIFNQKLMDDKRALVEFFQPNDRPYNNLKGFSFGMR